MSSQKREPKNLVGGKLFRKWSKDTFDTDKRWLPDLQNLSFGSRSERRNESAKILKMRAPKYKINQKRRKNKKREITHPIFIRQGPPHILPPALFRMYVSVRLQS